MVPPDPAAWCMVYGVWCMVYGVWCMVHGASQNPTGSKSALMRLCVCVMRAHYSRGVYPPPPSLAHFLFFRWQRLTFSTETETAPGDQDNRQCPLRLRYLPALPEHVLGRCNGPRQGTFRGGTHFARPTSSTASFIYCFYFFFNIVSPLPTQSA